MADLAGGRATVSPDKNQDRLQVGETVPKLTLRQLTYFLATANNESILRAAETLNVSSASISTAGNERDCCKSTRRGLRPTAWRGTSAR